MAGLRCNATKKALRTGRPVVCPSLGPNSLSDLESLEYLGAHGLADCAWIEMEHGNVGWSELSAITRACDVAGVTSMVRVQQNDRAIIGRVLDRGAQGILVPHVRTADDALAAVDAAYFAPVGTRGLARSRQSYGVSEYFADANDEVLVGVILEDLEAIDNLDDIVAVDGIDFFFVESADLSHSIDPALLGRMSSPTVQNAVKEAVRRISAAGRVPGAIVTDADVDEYIALGTRFLRINAFEYLETGLRRFRELVS